MPMRFALAGLVCSTLILQGCAHRQVNELAVSLPSNGPEQTLEQLKKLRTPGRDRAQYLLDMGVLKFYVGDLQGAQDDLQQAKGIMAALDAVSITENIGAATVNETLRAYAGTPTDKVLVHFYLGLAYLLNGDLDGARVEVLQADLTMQLLAEGQSYSGQLASVRFLAGLVYELNGEYDDALISYRRAYNIMQDRYELIPDALQVSLLNLTQARGFPDEYEQYVAEFGREAALLPPGAGEWLLFYNDGVVSTKDEVRFPVFDPGVSTMVTVVVPEYRGNYYRPGGTLLQSGSWVQRTEVLENLERRARDDLSAEMPGILAAATIRAAAKYTAVKSAQDQDNLIALIFTVAAFASEQADLRSWNMLPASIQVARVPAMPDAIAEIAGRGFRSPPYASFTDGPLVVLFASSISNRVFSYPPIDYAVSTENEYVEPVAEVEAAERENGEADVEFSE